MLIFRQGLRLVQKQKRITLRLAQVLSVSALLAAELLAAEFSLDEAIVQALEHNLDLKISEVQTERSGDGIDVAISEFDPSFSFNAGLGQNLSPINSSTLENTNQPFSESWNASASIDKKISYGTNFRIGTGLDQRETNSTTSAFNTQYDSNFFLRIDQPLLRGAGRRINLTNRLLAESNSDQAKIELLADAMDLLRDTELSYWQLAYSRARRELRQSSLEAAKKLLSETEERERIGVATKVDVLQARAALASRQESIILADESIAESQDNLAEIIGVKELADESLEVADIPESLVQPADREAFIENVMAFDLDRRSQLEVIKRSRLELERAKNQRKPELNLRFDGAYLGRDTTSSGAYDGAFDRDGYRWSGGVELRLPWGFRGEKARERQAQRDLELAELGEARIEQSLFYELRGAWRDLSTGHKRLEVAEIALRLQTEQFAEEEARYSAGLVTLREVLEAQEDLDATQLSYLDALIDTLQAEVVLGRLDGSLMERHDLKWSE